MLELTVHFDSYEMERPRKLQSMLELPETLEKKFLTRVRSRFSATESVRLEQALSFARGLKSTLPSHPSVRAYLGHPIRLALMADELLPAPDAKTIEICTVHNVLEVCGLTRKELLAAGFTADVIGALETLLIDRTQENDQRYLDSYYSKIKSYSPTLALVKCLDKLDNLWTLEVLADDVRRKSYIRHCRENVSPLAHGLSEDFGRYFDSTATKAEGSTFNPEFSARWKAFLTAHTP